MDVGLDISEVALVLLHVGDESAALAEFERVRAMGEDLVRADPNDVRARRFLVSVISRIALIRWQRAERGPALAGHNAALEHLDRMAAVMPDDVSVQRMRAEELAALGLGYAQDDETRSSGARCRRARPFLARALEEYRALAANNPLTTEATEKVSELLAAAAKCGSGSP